MRIKPDVQPADIVVRRQNRYPDIVRALRRHIFVRVLVCVLLSWAAADLLVPELCSAESSSASTTSPTDAQDHEDCFCCCTHTERAMPVTVLFAEGAPMLVETPMVQRLITGEIPGVYHPPLHS